MPPGFFSSPPDTVLPSQAAESTPEATFRHGQKQCIICNDSFYNVPGLAEDLCCSCESWLEAPATEAEVVLSAILDNFSYQDWANVGLGEYFKDCHLQLAQPPSTTSSTTSIPKRKLVDMQLGVLPQIHALQTPLHQESTNKRLRAAYGVNSSSVLSADLHPIDLTAATSTPPLHNEHDHETQSFVLQSQLKFEDQTRGKIDYSKRYTRMICAQCNRDMPIKKQNNGIYCTRCYNKLSKQDSAPTPSVQPLARPPSRSIQGTPGYIAGMERITTPQVPCSPAAPQSGSREPQGISTNTFLHATIAQVSPTPQTPQVKTQSRFHLPSKNQNTVQTTPSKPSSTVRGQMNGVPPISSTAIATEGFAPVSDYQPYAWQSQIANASNPAGWLLARGYTIPKQKAPATINPSSLQVSGHHIPIYAPAVPGQGFYQSSTTFDQSTLLDGSVFDDVDLGDFTLPSFSEY